MKLDSSLLDDFGCEAGIMGNLDACDHVYLCGSEPRLLLDEPVLHFRICYASLDVFGGRSEPSRFENIAGK